MSAFLLILFFGSLLVFTAIVCGTVYALFKIGRVNLSGHGGSPQAREAEIIQELHQSLERMEVRIEALETILMDTQEKDGNRR